MSKYCKLQRTGEWKISLTEHVHKQKVFFSNVDSLLNKRDLLKLHIAQYAPDIVCITGMVQKLLLPVQETE